MRQWKGEQRGKEKMGKTYGDLKRGVLYNDLEGEENY